MLRLSLILLTLTTIVCVAEEPSKEPSITEKGLDCKFVMRDLGRMQIGQYYEIPVQLVGSCTEDFAAGKIAAFLYFGVKWDPAYLDVVLLNLHNQAPVSFAGGSTGPGNLCYFLYRSGMVAPDSPISVGSLLVAPLAVPPDGHATIVQSDSDHLPVQGETVQVEDKEATLMERHCSLSFEPEVEVMAGEWFVLPLYLACEDYKIPAGTRITFGVQCERPGLPLSPKRLDPVAPSPEWWLRAMASTTSHWVIEFEVTAPVSSRTLIGAVGGTAYGHPAEGELSQRREVRPWGRGDVPVQPTTVTLLARQ